MSYRNIKDIRDFDVRQAYVQPYDQEQTPRQENRMARGFIRYNKKTSFRTILKHKTSSTSRTKKHRVCHRKTHRRHKGRCYKK